MSEMQPPSDEPSFAHYWAWVAREKVEQEVFRLMRTTPGIVDRSHVVEDVEAATKELVACRKEHLKDLLEGWEIMEKTMNKEIAVKIFNEFIAGSRTLEDFERVNFSRKYRDQQGKPRSHFPAHLNGHPMLSQMSISELHKSGVLPTTSTIYSANTAEYFEEKNTEKYYDLILGDVRVFEGVLTKHNPSPNMPPAKAIPMPYHPRMDKQDKDFLKWHQVTQPYVPAPQPLAFPPQQQQMAMPPMQHMPFVGYPPMPIQTMPPMQTMAPMQPMPTFIQVPVPMQPMAMQVPPQDGTYVGTSYQKHQTNGNSYGTERRERGSHRGGYRGKHSRVELHGRYQNGNDYNEQATSSGRSYRTRYVDTKEEEPSTSQAEEPVMESQEEAFPALEAQVASTSLSVDVTPAEIQGTSTPVKAASVVLPTPRSFSDVVSHSVSATASTVDISEPRATVDEEEEDPGNRPSSSSAETPSGTSDSRSVTSESVATTSETATTSSTAASASSKPSTSTDTPATSAVPSSLPSTSELVVDTTEQIPPAVPQASHKTVAEIVQQSLSAAPSPSSKRVNGVNSTQASPAVKSGTAASSPAQKGSRTAQTTPRETSSQENHNTDNRKSTRSPKKPSMSYAQMLYPKLPGESSGSSKNKKQSSSSSSSTPSNSQAAQKALPTDWHTVKTGKKSADPAAIVSPPARTPPLVRKPAPKPVPEPAASEDDEEDGTSDDPDAEKRREKRRNKRQLMKSENRQKKQQQKELARQESLARVEKMNGESKKEKEEEKKEGDEEKDPSPPPKPAFDRNDIAARRRKRLELQRKTEMESNGIPTRAPSPPIPIVAVPPVVPIVPMIPTKMGSNPMGAAIAAGQTAMSAYGLNSPFRPRASPFSFISPNGTAELPLYLPPQDGLRTSMQGAFAGALLLEDPVEDKKYIPVQLIRNVDPVVVKPEKTEIDENAEMVEKLLLFDSQEKVKELDLDPEDRSYIIKGLIDLKRMYGRVEKAGQLVSYKAGSSKVTTETEEKLLQLAVKLLSYRMDLNDADNKVCSDLGGKIATTSTQFNYTNFITALVSFADDRSRDAKEGSLRRCYEQVVVLTKVYLKRTKTLYEKVASVFDFGKIKNEEEEEEEEEDYNSLLL
ncbi:unnamed protein product [Caenorhabditis brenneri]